MLPEGFMSKQVLVSYLLKGLKYGTRKIVVLQFPISLYHTTELAPKYEHCLLDPITIINFAVNVLIDSIYASNLTYGSYSVYCINFYF